jgi:hypothetical protein
MAPRLLPLQLFSLSLLFSSHTLFLSRLLSQNYAFFIGINGKFLQHTFQSWWDKKALKHATNCGTNGASTKFSGGVLPQNSNILTITPFAICVGNYPLASSAQACILQLFQAYHSESIFNTIFPFECINHAWSGMIFQALHQGLQHPLKWKFLFPSAIVII